MVRGIKFPLDNGDGGWVKATTIHWIVAFYCCIIVGIRVFRLSSVGARSPSTSAASDLIMFLGGNIGEVASGEQVAITLYDI